MADFGVAELSALEILDSRGRPTLAVTVRLGDGTVARAGVPSGASTGSREAVERRDGDKARYEGKGVLGAAGAVNTEIADLLGGRSWSSLAEADQAMIDLDGTANNEPARRQRHRGRLDGAGAGAGRFGGGAAVAVAGPGGGGAADAGAAFQRAQRRCARGERAGFPGIHGGAAGGAVDGRGRPGRRGGVRRAAPRAGRPEAVGWPGR